MLTDEQIDRLCDECGAVVWGGSATEQAIRAAYRLGMLRAAEVCEELRRTYENEMPDTETCSPKEALLLGCECSGRAIRAEAGETSEPRKGE